MNFSSPTYNPTTLAATTSYALFRFTSTGKEKDSESGYHYFSARYYDSESLTGWLSVDPMADKYPSISPYAYCSWNPVKLVDPDGMSYDGYESTTGEYKWFDNHTEQCFADNNGVKWTKITDNKSDWIEATTIRDANIEGLVSLGYDRDQAGKDVRLYNADNSLFTKESILLNPDNYIKDWTASNNSGGPMAAESPEIKKSGYSLKYYPSKNGIKEALGIVKNNGFSHKVEAALELVERMVFKNNADKDPLYDMHYRNACGLIKGLHIKKADVSSYSNYHKSGGMKLP